jgi:hypothetical protein
LKKSIKSADKKLLAEYEKKAMEDKERYNNQIKDYVSPGVSDDESDPEKPKKTPKKTPKVKKTEEDEEKPKKVKDSGDNPNTTGYQVYCKENRKKFNEDNPGLKAKDITSLLANEWKKMTEEERALF